MMLPHHFHPPRPHPPVTTLPMPFCSFVFAQLGLVPYRSFGAALLQWHWVPSSKAVNSTSPFWRWPFFLLSSMLPLCHKFCSGPQGVSAAGCCLDQPLRALVVSSVHRRAPFVSSLACSILFPTLFVEDAQLLIAIRVPSRYLLIIGDISCPPS